MGFVLGRRKGTIGRFVTKMVNICQAIALGDIKSLTLPVLSVKIGLT